MALAYTNNFMTENKIVITVPYKLVERSLKYLKICLTKYVEDGYDGSFEILK